MYMDLPTQVDNTLTPDHAILVASIITGYDIDWAHLIIKGIHKWTLKRSTLIPFLCLIYYLCITLGVEILHNVDMMIEIQRT